MNSNKINDLNVKQKLFYYHGNVVWNSTVDLGFRTSDDPKGEYEYVKNPCLVFVSLLHVYTNIYCTWDEFCQASLLIFWRVRATCVNFLFFLLQDGRIDYNEFVAMMQKGNFAGPGKKGLQSSFSIAFR